jgi:hypothetical protein
MTFRNTFLFILLSGISLNLFSQKSTVSVTSLLTATAQFNISYPDTNAKEDIYVRAQYDSKNGYHVCLGLTQAVKADSFDLKQLNYSVFEYMFNQSLAKMNQGNKSKFAAKAISTISVGEVYRMVWNLNNPGADGTEAGVLQFNNQIRVYTDTVPADTTTLTRQEQLGSLNNRLMKYKNIQMLRLDSVTKWCDTISACARKGLINVRMDRMVFDKSLATDAVKLKSGLQDSAALKSIIASLIPVRNCYLKPVDSVTYQQVIKKVNFSLDSLAGRKEMIKSDSFKSFVSLKNYLVFNNYQRKEALLQDSIKNNYLFYDIKKVEVQFEQGFLERVKVTVDYKNTECIFENIYAIGFSCTKNFKRLYSVRLFARNSLSGKAPKILLGDVFKNYDNRLINYTRD